MSDWRDAFIEKAKIRNCPNCGGDGKGDTASPRFGLAQANC